MNKNKILSLSIIVIMLIALPLLLLAVRKNQDNRSSAAAADKLEAEGGVIGGNAQNKSDQTASGGQYIAFTNPSPTLTLTSTPSQPSLPVKAFPGAEGWGAISKGGRGGAVIEVTNLNDSGTGSLRAALSATGPRIIVFKTGGTINLASKLIISNPYITIAGQTAPGGGITLRGAGISVRTNDVIIRGLRIRPGSDSSDDDTWDALEVLGSGSRNVIIDHNSISWAVDENVSTWYVVQNISFQWNIISEALFKSIHTSGPHSMGLLLGGSEGSISDNISIHHNILAHNNQRNPRVQGSKQLEVINNIIYNWGSIGMEMTTENSGPAVNIISNYAKGGVNSGNGKWPRLLSGPAQSIYVSGNIGPGRTSLNQTEWDIMNGPNSLQRSTPWSMSSNPVSVTTYPSFTDTVYQCAGAVTPVRDSIDTRIINDIKNGTGLLIDNPSQVGGWPTISNGTAPTDSDHDGMPDSWETTRGLNPSNTADRNNLAPSGYTWVEEYINSLFPSSCL